MIFNHLSDNCNLYQKDCLLEPPPTSLATKAVFAVWVWAIFFTFPGTFSTQPAVTTQTFGHKYGGFIYAFLFSSDIINNLMVATLSKKIQESFGWLALFLIGIVLKYRNNKCTLSKKLQF